MSEEEKAAEQYYELLAGVESLQQELADAEKEIERLKELNGKIYKDLYMRAEPQEGGGVLFNLSHFLLMELRKNIPSAPEADSE